MYYLPLAFGKMHVCSYLVAYVLTLEVMTVKKNLKTWKSVQSCSVEVDESREEPSSLSETIIMNQVGQVVVIVL